MIRQMFRSMKRILGLNNKKDSRSQGVPQLQSQLIDKPSKFNRAKEATYFIKKKLKNRRRRKLANQSRRINRLVSA